MARQNHSINFHIWTLNLKNKDIWFEGQWKNYSPKVNGQKNVLPLPGTRYKNIFMETIP